METDPSDGRVTFTEVDTGGFAINSLVDVKDFWMELSRICLAMYNDQGHVIYPIVRLPYEQG